MEEKKAVTSIDLAQDEQIKMILQMMIDHGGKAEQEDIEQILGHEINGELLYEYKKWLTYEHEKELWRITPEGRDYIEESRESDRVEEEEILSDNTDDSSILNPYDPSQINVDLTHFTVFHVMRKIELGEINLQPDFQRRIVWDETRQSRLIESILIRIPLPAFYLDAVDYDNWLVIDGLQRLFTLHKFFNKNQLRLKNLEFLTELEGHNRRGG